MDLPPAIKNKYAAALKAYENLPGDCDINALSGKLVSILHASTVLEQADPSLTLFDPTWLGTLYRMAGRCYTRSFQFAEARRYLDLALLQSARGGDAGEPSPYRRLEASRCHRSRGRLCMAMGRTTEAVAEMEHALAWSRRHSLTDQEAKTLICLAELCILTGQFEQGLLHLDSAERLCRPLRNIVMRCMQTVFTCRINLLVPLGRYYEALDATDAYMKFCNPPAKPFLDLAAPALVAMGNCFVQMADENEHRKKAQICFQEALSIYGDLGMKCSLPSARLFDSMGQLSLAEDDAETALSHFSTSLAFLQKRLDPWDPRLAVAHSNVATALQALGRGAEAEKSRELAAVLLRRSQIDCAGPGCLRKMREDGTPLTVCTKCNATHYCSTACQRGDWQLLHRVECAELVAKAAADAAAAAVSAVEANPVRYCAGPGCARAVREDGSPLDVCVKCRRAFYCGRDCQLADWKRVGGHKVACKAMSAASGAVEEQRGGI